MSTSYYQKPPQKPVRQSNGRVYYHFCNHIVSSGERQGQPCNAETLNGSYACPELQAAVSRAEATLAAAEPAYVGLQDPELDADYDAMKHAYPVTAHDS